MARLSEGLDSSWFGAVSVRRDLLSEGSHPRRFPGGRWG